MSHENLTIMAHLQELKSSLLQGEEIVIFGAGNLGRKVGSFLLDKGYNLKAFSDNNQATWGKKGPGEIDIQSPRDISTSIVIVAIWSPGCSYVEIYRQLQGLGIDKVYHAAHLMQLFPEELLPHYHFQTPNYYLDHIDEIEQVIDWLGDEESKKQYKTHIDCRINLSFDKLPVPDIKNQYFPEGLIKLSDQEVFVDVGAFDGDTLKDFIGRVNGFRQYFAFEPDPSNHQEIGNFIKANDLEDVKLLPYAIGAEEGQIHFDATGGGGAAINAAGNIQVDLKTIDDLFASQPVTFLKFDIEGAELDALKGARETIIRDKPTMAVCIYHLPDDLWQIPKFIQEQFPFYHLYVRTHQYDGLDFVLYCVPEGVH